MPKEKVIEVKVPIHEWLVKRDTYEPGLRQKLEQELGRKAFEVAKAASRS